MIKAHSSERLGVLVGTAVGTCRRLNCRRRRFVFVPSGGVVIPRGRELRSQMPPYRTTENKQASEKMRFTRIVELEERICGKVHVRIQIHAKFDKRSRRDTWGCVLDNISLEDTAVSFMFKC